MRRTAVSQVQTGSDPICPYHSGIEPITEYLRAWEQGDDGALERLLPLVYTELRAIAARHLGEARLGVCARVAVESPEWIMNDVQRLHELFDELVDLPVGERAVEIARIAAHAPELADDLRALLDHAARTDSPLDNAAVRLGEEGEPPLPHIPGFRIHRRIGRGGQFPRLRMPDTTA